MQHGITGNRTQALAMADSFADACYVVASMDLPLHGLTPDTRRRSALFYCSSPTNPACLGARERTFDVDLVNNASTGSAVPDGLIDPSGTHFINLPSPLTSRDNLRQAEADLITFAKSAATLDLDGGGADIDRGAHQLRRPVARFDGRHRQHRLHRQLTHVGALGAGRRDHAS